MLYVIGFALTLLVSLPAFGQFSETGQVNTEYDRSDPSLAGWATQVVSVVKGYQDYALPELGLAAYGEAADCLGAAGTPVSLGDAGSVTLAFDLEIANGPGDDFVVFENGFAYNGIYMELGFVEVSSNGTDFSRLPALCRRDTQPGPWDSSASDQFYNLAGNFAGGTGFDLEDLVQAGDPRVQSGAVDLDHVIFVRIVDVVGDITGPGGSVDHLGRPVADPYPTTGESSGMDLTGVAVINTGAVAVEESSWGSVKSLFR